MRLTTRRHRRDDSNVIPFPAAGLDAAIARHPSSQDPRAGVSRPASSGRPRPGGLVRRARTALARRYLRKLGPAVVPPLVAGAVALLAVGVIVGLVLGVALATSAYRPEPGE